MKTAGRPCQTYPSSAIQSGQGTGQASLPQCRYGQYTYPDRWLQAVVMSASPAKLLIRSEESACGSSTSLDVKWYPWNLSRRQGWSSLTQEGRLRLTKFVSRHVYPDLRKYLRLMLSLK
jgi:hypothetical protein